MLTASGHPAAEGWHETEAKLVAELKAVLAKPEYQAVSTWFRGVHTAASNLHEAAPPPPAMDDAKPAASRRGKAAATEG